MNKKLSFGTNQKPDLQMIDISATGEINFAESSSNLKDAPSKFNILAYNGGVVYVGYYGPIVIDLDGMKIPKQVIPILDSHEKSLDSVLGRTEKIEIIDGVVRESGILYSNSDETAAKVVAKAKDGHPWESSIGAMPLVLEEILQGASDTVNGQEIKGPVWVAKESELRETSIVVHGADRQTSIDIAAKQTLTPKKTIMFFNP